MSGWYGHIVKVNIQNGIDFPNFSGRLSIINPFVKEETARLERKVKYLGAQISYEVALHSQIAQRDTITKLKAVDTGRLRESVKITGNGLTSFIGTDLYYAEQVHDIGYKRSGSINVRKSHGIGPRPWVTISAERVAGEIDSIVKSSFEKAFR